jgi:hypothetical protein
MKKYLLCVFILAFCGLVLAQTIKNADYPDIAPFMRFWGKLQTKVAAGEIDLGKNYDIRIRSNFSEKKVSKGDLKLSINENAPALLELLKEFMTAVDESRLLTVIALDGFNENLTSADLQVKFDETDVNFKVVLKADSEVSAQNIASRFRVVFGLTARITEGSPEEEFYKNAVVTTEKEQLAVSGKISRANFEQFLKNL